MSPCNWRERFEAFAINLAAELGIAPEHPNRRVTLDALNVGFEIRDHVRRLRLLHSAQPACERFALVEIVVAPPAAQAACALYASLLAMNASAWPQTYALDADTGGTVLTVPLDLMNSSADEVAQQISEHLADFEEWAAHGLLASNPELAT